MNPTAEQIRETEVPKVRYAFLGEPLRDTWLSGIVICLMAATMLALFYYPLRRSLANVEVNYNEGWNTYQAARIASGVPLYGAPPGKFGTGTGYPPLSFHLVALLGHATSFVAAGRWISLISMFATGILISLIVKEGGGSWPASIFSFLLYAISIMLLRADRVGMYDPQLLGEAVSTAGLYLYIRKPDSTRFLILSALFFCVAGFTKHNLLAFPAAVALDLLLKSVRAFLTWAGAMALFASLLLGGTILFDGRYFLLHLMGGGGGGARAYSYMFAWSQFYHYIEKFQTLVVIGTAWSIHAFRSRRIFALAFVITHLLAFWMAGGFGVDMNIFFNALAATAIACGLALSDVDSALVTIRPGALNSTAAFMFGLFFISIMIFVPGQLRRDRKQLRLLPTQEKEFNSAAEFEKSHPGPALCESLLLCYEAGKPFEYEPFSVWSEIKSGKRDENEVLRLLETHHFQTVEVEVHTDEEELSDPDLLTSLGSDQKGPDKERGRFSPNFMKELLANYRLSLRTSRMAVFCPK